MVAACLFLSLWRLGRDSAGPVGYDTGFHAQQNGNVVAFAAQAFLVTGQYFIDQTGVHLVVSGPLADRNSQIAQPSAGLFGGAEFVHRMVELRNRNQGANFGWLRKAMDINNWLKAILVIAAISSSVLSATKSWMEIKTMLSAKNSSAPIRSSAFTRNWPLLLVCALGMAGMFSIALAPLSPSSVLFCVLGGVFTAIAVTGIAMLEIARQLAHGIASGLEARD